MFRSPMVSLCDGTHAFLKDVAFNHPTFGLTLGIVHNILQQVVLLCLSITYHVNCSCQESNSYLLIDIEMLLSFQQFILLVPSTKAYIPDDI